MSVDDRVGSGNQQVVAPTVEAWPAMVGRLRGSGLVGGLFVMTAGIHVGVVAADPQVYATFADQALVPVLRTWWREWFMAAPVVFGLLVALAELLAGVTLLAGRDRRLRRFGWATVTVFHLLLLSFGWWAWVWSVPALLTLLALARADEHRP